jgi:hypothetical protein
VPNVVSGMANCPLQQSGIFLLLLCCVAPRASSPQAGQVSPRQHPFITNCGRTTVPFWSSCAGTDSGPPGTSLSGIDTCISNFHMRSPSALPRPRSFTMCVGVNPIPAPLRKGQANAGNPNATLCRDELVSGCQQLRCQGPGHLPSTRPAAPVPYRHRSVAVEPKFGIRLLPGGVGM